jgi:hypothetical protein
MSLGCIRAEKRRTPADIPVPAFSTELGVGMYPDALLALLDD